MHHSTALFSLSLALILSTTARGQQPADQAPPWSPTLPPLLLTGPASGTDDAALTTGLPPLSHYQDAPGGPAAPAGAQWKSAVTLGAMASSGNTRRRTSNASAEMERRHGAHRTTAKAAWNYAQTKSTDADATGAYELDQRHTQGVLKQDYFIAEKSFLFASVDGTHDYSRNLALRLATTAGYGVQVIDTDHTQYSMEIGLGHYSETSRSDNTPRTDYATARVVSNLEARLGETWQLLNTISYHPSLESSRDLTGTCDTRLRAKMAEGLFAQLQWIVEYDNTPLADAAGNPNTRVDHQIFLSVGWSF